MEDFQDIPDDSLKHIEALLTRHPPGAIMRMFQQVAATRRNSTASSASSSHGSFLSRLSTVSSLSTASSEFAPSIASSTSSIRSRTSRQEPRSYPHSLDPSRGVPTPLQTPISDIYSPVDYSETRSIAPTESELNSTASPSVGNERGQGSESYWFCTFCPDLKTFCAKSDWKKHEMRMHETGEDWPCPVPGCSRIFDREKDFLRHCQRYHPGRQLPSLTDIRIQLLPRNVFGCGFDNCKDFIVGWDDRCNHVADHMKRGKTFSQWKYSNVIRNLIRQDATRDTWKELLSSLHEMSRKGRSQITWCPDNTRILKQKLECCDLRPNREEVLLTALSLRSDLHMDPRCTELPDGFVTPSRDSVPSNIPPEQRMGILNGDPNGTVSRFRFNLVKQAIIKAAAQSMPQPITPLSAYDGSAPSFTEPTDTDGRRISLMDLDLDPGLEMQDTILTNNVEPQIAQIPDHGSTFVDPGKSSNPLIWGYPNYYDAPPTFEQSQYYQRPSFGQIISGPIKGVKSRLHSSKRTQQAQAAQRAQQPLPAVPPIPQHHLNGGMRVSYQQHNPDGSVDPHMHMFAPQS